MKKLAYTYLALIMLFGCESFNQALKDNETAAYLITSQGVARIIQNSSTPQERAERILKAADGIESGLSGDVVGTVDALVELVNANIDTSKLTPADKLLINDLLMIVKTTLSKEAEKQNGKLTPETMLSFRKMLQAARNAAGIFIKE